MVKIAFFDTKPYDLPEFEKQGRERGIEFKFLEPRLDSDTVSLARGCDGVCAFVNDTVDARVIDALAADGIGLVAMRCSGYNNVDLARARGKLTIVHVPAYSPCAVAEHAMAMLLTSVRRIHKAYIRTRDFNFSLNGMTGFELHGKTVGVIGTGRIGRAFIDICHGFGMKILAYDKYPDDESGIPYVSLERVWRESDVISFHCPLTPDTYHMLDSRVISKLKRGVVIVNTSRGALIDSAALLEGIRARIIGATCLDVYEEESDVFFEDFSGHIPQDETLASLIFMPNVIVTSHQAFLTREALASIAHITATNIVEFVNTGRCKNQVLR
jgi:D-lactate dehydrogenase